jgi:hypothetical protein
MCQDGPPAEDSGNGDGEPTEAGQAGGAFPAMRKEDHHMTTTTTTTAHDTAQGPQPQPLGPPPATTVPWVLDLVSGISSTPKPAAITLTTNPVLIGSAYPGWMRAGLKINMSEFKQANFVLEYEGVPEGHTVDIGDSPTNDGWGGDAGSASCAEVHIVSQNVLIYGKAYAPGHVHQFAALHDSLEDGALKVVVRDKFVSVGQPHFQVQNAEMFQLPDGTNPDRSTIYAAFNSVITQRKDRYGKGLRRVMITLQ